METSQEFVGIYISGSDINDPKRLSRDFTKGFLNQRLSAAYEYEITKNNYQNVTALKIQTNTEAGCSLIISRLAYQDINCMQLLVREFREEDLDQNRFIQIDWDRMYKILDMYDQNRPIQGIYDGKNELAVAVERAYVLYQLNMNQNHNLFNYCQIL